MYDYKSPIEIIAEDVYKRLSHNIENDIMTAVAYHKIRVDKEELLKALAYDRGQYGKGYDDGYRAAKKELVRCGKCVFFGNDAACPMLIIADHTKPDFFCGYAERRNDD